ncbi:OLC1v1023789C1 [Oldenlandia corymbosa var. corymbosa]|uniref:OLC1v1023789C1 n=1 Tax=Oldenlandia corymbosa var. corymbosa TaxID=529605 RepID=A0AAV1C4D3_OLDCO|nr:OLC1v1023789C1 [Oldenlandia corymbosa var. corymbosa]
MSNCRSLNEFFVNRNNLQRRIPSGIWNVSSLQHLCLGANNLTGFFFLSFFLFLLFALLTGTNCLAWAAGRLDMMSSGNSSVLEVIEIGVNEFYGCLPDDMCFSHPNLEWLELTYTQLSGQITSSLSHSRALCRIHLSSNNFSGSIPPEIVNMSALQVLLLSNNSLTGELTLPSSSNLSALKTLDSHRNLLSGSLPPDLGFRFPNLEVLNLGSNQFSGKIPAE